MKGKLQTAVHYVLNQKKELMAFLKDGRLEASNNRAERAIKTVVIGRKNYLFSTSLSGLKPMRSFIASFPSSGGLDYLR